MDLLGNTALGRGMRSSLRWLNDWLLLPAGGEDRPGFLDIDQVYPALRGLEKAYPDIRAEAMALLGDLPHVPQYSDMDPGQRCVADVTPGDWRIFYLYAMGIRAEANMARCPRTSAAVEAIPGLFHAQFSLLDAGKSIPSHRGPYSGYLRYHLGVVVPEVDPPRIRVAKEYREWHNGEGLLFDDRHYHEVYNTAAEPRIVLIVDVLRPMPFPQSAVNRALVPLIRRFYARRVLERAERYATTVAPAATLPPA